MQRANVDPNAFQALEWRLIGPHRGGRVTTVVGHPTERTTFYFGACAGGVWRSIDAGLYWENISDGYLNTAAIGALAISTTNPNVLYIGTGESAIRNDVSHGDGVYRSTDAGSSWQHVGLTDTRHIARLRIHPEDPDTVYVAAFGHAWGPNAERGVFRTTDGGASWEQVLFNGRTAGAIDLTMDPHNPRVIVAALWDAQRYPHALRSGGDGSGIWKTIDGGDSWFPLTRHPGLPEGVFGKIGVALSPSRPERIWAMIEAERGGLFRSDDGGSTWELMSDDRQLRRRPWYFTRVYADPHDPETVWVTNVRCWKSTDGGRSFVGVSTPHTDCQDLWIDPTDSNRMMEGNDGGACVSLNGGKSWSSILNQPTAQFYHVCADNHVPYRVYGAQQDTSPLALPSRSARGAISMQEWFQPAGGECGYIAIRPDNPDIMYGGAPGPRSAALFRYNHATFEERVITVWPEVPGMGRGAEAHRYRFQWTFPIELSPHDPNVLYVASNHLHRSTNEGMSWEVISPDLTRNDPIKLGPSGGPITNENTGAEFYCTIFAFKESAHEQGVMWAGSDDGLVHLTRDGGDTWACVTPPELPKWAMISIIELSPHDPATAYIAATRYKHDDNTPYLYKTGDYGQNWTLITTGIPEQDFTRVIREDPVRRGLLYAGTESGVYVSLNDGRRWQRLQLNLPVCPIYDLVVKDRDLIVATHGRSFWILDDLTPLRQVDETTADAPAHLYAPEPAYRFRVHGRLGQGLSDEKTYGRISGLPLAYRRTLTDTGDSKVEYLDAGSNPPAGVAIDYYLRDLPASDIRLSIHESNGELIKEFSSALTESPDQRRLPKRQGGNRFVWDMCYSGALGVPGHAQVAYRVAESLDGPVAAPGQYRAHLTVDGRVFTTAFEIHADPRVDATQEDLEEQFRFAMQVRDKLSETHLVILDLRVVRDAILACAQRAEVEALVDEATAIACQLDDIELALIQPDAGNPRQLPSGLNDHLGALPAAIANSDSRPTQQIYQVFDKVTDEINQWLHAWNELRSGRIDRFYQTAASLGTPVEPF